MIMQSCRSLMSYIRKKITSRSGLVKAIVVIRELLASFKMLQKLSVENIFKAPEILLD